MTIFFGVFSSFSVWIMGFARSWSAVTNLGVWGWATKCLSKGLLPLSSTHASLLLFQPPDLQLGEVLPLTSFFIYWLLPRLGHQNLVQTFLPLWWQNCTKSREDWHSGQRAFYQLLPSLWPGYQLQPLTTSSDAFIKKHRWVSKGSRLVWIRHEGVARHFFPKLSDHSHSGVASYTGARCKLCWDNPLHLICKVYWLWVCPQGSWVVLC